MEAEIIIAVLSMFGTAFGSVIGVMTANKLSNYRIEQLEKKVEKHNNLCDRMIIVEQSVKSAHHRLDEMLEEEK
ncbi:hypothetical protein [Murimonas intestini]|uniref:hypothetical protein n=1 Tax=Murimonas intestini TaxID=1337051 RepID=UPI0011DDC3BF|nr:hypothetical protein [Murimonas intestini]